MWQTARAILNRDPAATNLGTIILTYPGIHALAWYRVAHYFETHHLPLMAALLSQHAARRTGILIHPAAQIGHRVFLDHGIGTVIGATAVIEDDVTILHGVTLGARKTEQAGRRHPYVGRGAFIGAHAQILGPITIGAHSKIGAGAIVLDSVPAHVTAVGNPAHLVTARLHAYHEATSNHA
ncbi:serine O-acetyltransferase EpsC [Lactiplantibacillus paraplantarum]|uniref:serine O-acetyltransferase EpsC n=1 Tax=Lactiplantibacillus paraplantarum TaxID=60520 RepID=UPI0023AB3193|nr:serine O-acetyltransferase EpsC [Lactiplantibacillus paraplantarum]WEE36216.1 serine O-acetyltransferase [Lactiplantibacillus paraplantarum]